MCQNCLNPEFREIIVKRLGKTFQKHWKRLAIDILSVSTAVKPSFLVDYGTRRTTEDWRGVSQELFDQGLVDSDTPLDVLNVDDGSDVFLIHKTVFEKLTVTDMHTQIVDVSADIGLQQTGPKLLTTDVKRKLLNEMITAVQDIVVQSGDSDERTSSVIQMQPPDCVNRTSLYGLILGYPVAYWYKLTDGQRSENCLDMQPLCVNKLAFQLSCVGDDSNCVKHDQRFPTKKSEDPGSVVFSFSYPEEFDNALQADIVSWLSEIKSRVSKQGTFSDCTLSKEMITLPVVAL